MADYPFTFKESLMPIICLTGGIAAGKSTAARYFATRGAKIIDADQLGHATYEAGTAANDRLVETFGAAVRAEDGGIDRKALGGMVFGKPEALKQLTDIVWPEIRLLAEAQTRNFLEEDPSAIVILGCRLVRGRLGGYRGRHLGRDCRAGRRHCARYGARRLNA